MGREKTDWEGQERPIFNAQKYGQVKSVTDADGNVQRVVVDPAIAQLQDYEGAGEQQGVVPTERGGRIQNYMPYFVDGSDAMANKGFIVSFQHVPSEQDVNFKAFITAFNETYNVDWASETVYGRADPIYMYKNTGREITLALNLPASTEGEAFENLARVQQLVKFLYPTYADSESSADGNVADRINALTISNSPLVRLRVMNLLAARPQIGDAAGGPRAGEEAVYGTLGTFERHVSEEGGGAAWPSSNAGSNTIAKNFHGGLLGVIKNLTVNHNLDNPDHGVFEINKGTILPKMIEINLTFGCIHEHTVGWLPDGDSQTFANSLFPYGVKLTEGETLNNYVDDATVNAALNQSNYENLTGSLDQLAEQVEQNETDIANAEARYAGLFGRARFRRDQRRDAKGKGNDYTQSAMRGAQALADVDQGTNSEGEQIEDRWDDFVR